MKRKRGKEEKEEEEAEERARDEQGELESKRGMSEGVGRVHT